MGQPYEAMGHEPLRRNVAYVSENQNVALSQDNNSVYLCVYAGGGFFFLGSIAPNGRTTVRRAWRPQRLRQLYAEKASGSWTLTGGAPHPHGWWQGVAEGLVVHAPVDGDK